MIKIYKIVGIVECSKTFRHGPILRRCDFAGGSVNESNYVPATYSTNNELTQFVIEMSKEYKSGYIQIESEIPEDADIKKEVAKNAESKNEEKSYPEVTNTQMAKDILMGEFNVDLAELGNKQQIKAKGEELGVTFPNWR